MRSTFGWVSGRATTATPCGNSFLDGGSIRSGPHTFDSQRRSW
jgi:hypothetical protein